MKVAIDVSPLNDTRILSHRVRGTGFYLKNLKESLLKTDHQNQYVFFDSTQKLQEKVDVIHYPYFEPFFLTLPLLNIKRTVVTVHDLTPLVFPTYFPSGVKGKLKWQFQKVNLMKSKRIITDSESSKRDICKFTGIPEDKIDVIYLAAGEEFKKVEENVLKAKSQKLIAKYALPQKFVLYVGDATWNKNLPRLIDAVNYADLPLIMVGKTLIEENFDRNNPWNKDLFITQQKANKNKKISLLGFVPTEDLVLLYNLASVFVMPSIYEGFGLPVLEAMQSGCPVITTKNGSIPEVAGNAAFYVNSEDSHDISRGIKEVFENHKLRRDLSYKGLQQAKNFSWNKTAKDTILSYKKALDL